MRKTIFVVVVAALLAAGVGCSAPAPSPPRQPAAGPGGKAAPYARVIATSHGAGPTAYWLFEPADPTPQRAPLIVFNHGWGAMDPRAYEAWIDHIVERGNIVVYPLYQDSLRTPVKDFTPNAIAAVKDAIVTLQNEPGQVRPALEAFAIVGHSMGGPISANMAALWRTEGLPFPRAIMCVEPGTTWGRAKFELADLSQIPAGALLLTVTGDEDRLVRDIDAKRIFRESTSVPLADKDSVTLVSDSHGRPALRANHFALVASGEMPEGTQEPSRETVGPVRALLRRRIEERMRETQMGGEAETADLGHARGTVDALDFYGTWKLFDGLTDAAFFGTNRQYALGGAREQRFMGTWSDGAPVKALLVTDQP